MRYSTRAAAVRRWPYREFQEALIICEAEAGYRVTREEIDDDLNERHGRNRTYILDYLPSFFAEKSADELLIIGFTEEQIPYIEEELVKLGLKFRQ